MEKQFEIIKKTRLYLLSLINELSTAQLNIIPTGFKNNIAWNFGHIIAAQQGVCYKRGGTPMRIEETLFEKYKPESVPAASVGDDELSLLKSLLFSTIDELETDYRNSTFVAYKPWTSRYGIDVKNIDDAISFLPFHDGLHIGYIMALRKAVTAGS